MSLFQRTSIIVFPENTGKLFQLRVPVLLLRFGMAFLLISGPLLGLFIYEYCNLKDRALSLTLKEASHKQEERQILRLARRIIQVEQETEKLESLISCQQPKESGHKEITRPSYSGYASTAGMHGLVRLMHLSLDHLDEKLSFFQRAIQDGPPFNYASNESGFHRYLNDPAISHEIRRELVTASAELGLDPGLAFAMAQVESGFDATLISSKGAVGVLQVMPRFALEEHGITRDMLFNPKINIRTGLSIMKNLMDRFNQDLDLSLAAYNAGASRVIKAGYRIPDIRETRRYVKKVKKAMIGRSLPVYASLGEPEDPTFIFNKTGLFANRMMLP